MATTKWARYKFVVKESATEAREIREGFIDIVADPFLVAEVFEARKPPHPIAVRYRAHNRLDNKWEARVPR